MIKLGNTRLKETDISAYYPQGDALMIEMSNGQTYQVSVTQEHSLSVEDLANILDYGFDHGAFNRIQNYENPELVRVKRIIYPEQTALGGEQ